MILPVCCSLRSCESLLTPACLPARLPASPVLLPACPPQMMILDKVTPLLPANSCLPACLPQMILDKVFAGTLDQGAGCLEVFEEQKADGVYPTALEVVESMGGVVDTLFARSQKIVV